MNPKYEQIKALFPLIERRLGWRSAEWVVMGRRTYRGKERYVAGYAHCRVGAHHLSGIAYDRIIGYGETQDAAINMMRNRLKAIREHAKAAEINRAMMEALK